MFGNFVQIIRRPKLFSNWAPPKLKSEVITFRKFGNFMCMTRIENRYTFFSDTTLRHWVFDILETNALSGKLEDPLLSDAASYNTSRISQLHSSENVKPRGN